MKVELNHKILTELLNHAVNWVGPINYNSTKIAATKIMEELESGATPQSGSKDGT
jgi:hypothetical protein